MRSAIRNAPLAAMSAAAALLAVSLGQAEAADGGEWVFDTRLRYESVDQDGLDDADALTWRARAGYQTPAWRGFRALAELEGVVHLIDDFNDTVHGRVNERVIADPEAFELNRLQVSWSGDGRHSAVLGRQRIVFGNARFIGNVGFRQNEQTFDALRASAQPFDGAVVSYLYIDRVHRVFGDDSPQGEWDSDSHVLQAEFDLPIGRLTGYGLLLDFQNAPNQSSQTFGLRWSREWEAGAFRPRMTLEAAQQSDYRNNGASFDVGYQHAEVALRHGRFGAALGAERLEGDGVRGFSTPLATLHAFQGWADVFLSTPADGVRDLNARISYALPSSV